MAFCCFPNSQRAFSTSRAVMPLAAAVPDEVQVADLERCGDRARRLCPSDSRRVDAEERIVVAEGKSRSADASGTPVPGNVVSFSIRAVSSASSYASTVVARLTARLM